nr:hypothetical protein [Tanacetum cinerariifolium]
MIKKKVYEDQRLESECKDQEKEDNVNNTNNLNDASTNRVNDVGANTNNELPFDPEMPTLEDISTFNFSSDHEDADEEANINNMDTTIQKELCNAFEKMRHEKFQMSSIYILSRIASETDNASTLMETQKPLLKDEDGEEVDVHMYRSMIDSLMYLTSLKPDIMFVVCACARYQEEMSNHNRIYVTPSHTNNIFWNMKKVGKEYYGRDTPLFPTMIVQAQEDMGEDEAVNKETDDSLERAATIATSLDVEHGKGGGFRCQEAMRYTIAHTWSKRVSKISNDPLITGVNTPQSGEDSLKLTELMELCTNLQQRVLDLETTKTTHALKINNLKRRVKKLERRKRSRTHGIKRLYNVGLLARVESFADEGLVEEDASKQRRIADIDANEDITLVSTYDEQMFNVDQDLGDCQLAETLQAEEQQELNDKEKAKFFMQLLEKRRKFFVVKTAEEKRNKPPPQAQQRKNNVGSKRVNTFVDYRTELVEESSNKHEVNVTEGSSKRVGTELKQESVKKQKIDDDKEIAELKQLVNIIPDEEGVAIDAIPLVVKPLNIVD